MHIIIQFITDSHYFSTVFSFSLQITHFYLLGLLLFVKANFSTHILKRWWNFDYDKKSGLRPDKKGKYFLRHPYEQHAFNKGILRYDQGEYRKHIAQINFNSFKEWPCQFIRHVGGSEDLRRRRMSKMSISSGYFRQKIAENYFTQIVGSQTEIFTSMIRDIKQHHMRSINREQVLQMGLDLEAEDMPYPLPLEVEKIDRPLSYEQENQLQHNRSKDYEVNVAIGMDYDFILTKKK